MPIVFCSSCGNHNKRSKSAKPKKEIVISPKQLHGCVADVSGHCPKVDYQHLVDNGIVGVYIKATEGASGKGSRNVLYEQQYKEAKKVGLKVGAFHYLKATSTISSQFENFTSVAPKSDVDLIPIINIEDDLYKYWKNKSQTQDSITKFVRICSEYYGKQPIIYGTQRSYNTYCAPKFNNYHLMIGKYGKGGYPGKEEPEIIGKGTYTLWQFTDQYKTGKGHSAIDISRFNKGYSIEDIEL